MKRLITVLRDGDKGGALWSAHTLAGLLDRLHGAVIVIVQFVDTYAAAAYGSAMTVQCENGVVIEQIPFAFKLDEAEDDAGGHQERRTDGKAVCREQ